RAIRAAWRGTLPPRDYTPGRTCASRSIRWPVAGARMQRAARWEPGGAGVGVGGIADGTGPGRAEEGKRPGPGTLRDEGVEELVCVGLERRGAHVDRVEENLEVAEIAGQRRGDGATAGKRVPGEHVVERRRRAVVEVRRGVADAVE